MGKRADIYDYKNVCSSLFGTIAGGWLARHRAAADVVAQVRLEADMYLTAMQETAGWHPDTTMHCREVLERLLAQAPLFLATIDEGIARHGENPSDMKEAYNTTVSLFNKNIRNNLNNGDPS